MRGKPLFILLSIVAFMIVKCGPAASEEGDGKFTTVYRHRHFFLMWNEGNEAPKIVLACRPFGKYADPLAYQVIDAASEVLAEGEFPPGAQRTVSGLPCGPKYLISADPGYNGMTIEVERPYGIVGDRSHPLGLNHPEGRLFLYVPAGCEAFTLYAKAQSPHEGAWVKVFRPDGQPAGEAKGELDDETAIKVAVPKDCRGKAWSIEFAEPGLPGVGLDDLNLFVEGNLAPLFVPDREWAERYAKTVKYGEK